MGGQYSRAMFYLLHRLHWPAVCEVCARWPAQPVCADCYSTFAPLQHRCPACALPMAPGLELCVRCREDDTPRWLARCVARVDYAYPWTDLVARFKFQQQPAWAHQFALWMLQAPEAQTLLRQATLLVPIPSTAERLRERGYNQAWELATALRRHSRSHARTLPDLLLRQPQSQVQHTLSAAERQANAHQSLTLHPGHRRALQHQRVLLVDDVMTTGTTLQAAAQRLREAGAHSVSAIVFARTPAPGSVE